MAGNANVALQRDTTEFNRIAILLRAMDGHCLSSTGAWLYTLACRFFDGLGVNILRASECACTHTSQTTWRVFNTGLSRTTLLFIKLFIADPITSIASLESLQGCPGYPGFLDVKCFQQKWQIHLQLISQAGTQKNNQKIRYESD